MFIWTFPFWFAMTWCPSATSIYLSVSSNVTKIKYETCSIILHVATSSKIQLVYWKISPNSLSERLSLTYIRAIDAYVFWSLSLSPFSDSFCNARLPRLSKQTCFFCFYISLGGFGSLSIRWCTYLHLKHLRGVR